MRNAARAAAEEGSRARGKALVRALAVLALAGAAIIGTQFLACGEKSAEAPADPVELEKSDPRVAELLVPCVNGGFYDRDTSDVVVWRQLHRNTGFVNALFVLAGVLAFIVLVEWTGFLLITTLVLAVLMWRLRVRLVGAVPIAALFAVLMYALFAKLLRVPLPLGLVWW